MIGPMIPASSVRAHLLDILNSSIAARDGSTVRLIIGAGEDMNLLDVDERDTNGNPIKITWKAIQ